LAIKETEIKARLRVHHTPARMAIIKETNYDTYTLLVKIQISAATMEISMKFPWKLKMQLPYDPAVLLLGIYPKESKSACKRDTCTPVF
jgi:hypothetical protein